VGKWLGPFFSDDRRHHTCCEHRAGGEHWGEEWPGKAADEWARVLVCDGGQGAHGARVFQKVQVLEFELVCLL